jgi:hypothetical protein
MYRQGLATATELLLAYREVAVAARDGLVGDKLRKELATYRDAMVQLQGTITSRVQLGSAGPKEAEHAREALAEAEYWLEEASEEGEASPGK